MEKNNIENKEQTDKYDKLIAGNGDLFSESGFDEMQKARNYEIGFKIFRMFFWAVYFMVVVVWVVAMALESKLVMAIGIVFMALCDIFYLLYAAKVSSLGVMNLDFAKRMSNRSIMIAYIFMAVIWIINLFLSAAMASAAIMMILLSVLYIGLHICAKRNMKVLEKMMSEENDSTEE